MNTWLAMKRFQKIVVYLLVVMVVLVMSWEYQRGAAASVMLDSTIPDDSIRLRVLSHTDSVQDQWLKNEVRDEVVAHIDEWVKDVASIDEARAKIKQYIPELEKIVEETIEDRGYAYSSSVEFGDIEFPAKLYGQQLYPAGVYEGLLITIGEGQGDNWWCVLFPPLCFVDFGTGETIKQEDVDEEGIKEEEQQEENTTEQSTEESSEEKETDATNVDKEEKDSQSSEEKDAEKSAEKSDEKEENSNDTSSEDDTVEVKFFFAELFDKIRAIF